MREKESEGYLSFLGDPFSPTPLDRLRYSISRYLRNPLPGSKVSPSHQYPPRDGAHCMLPMQVCSVYMSVVRGSFFDSGTGTDRSLTPACDSYSPDSPSLFLCLSICLFVVACLCVCLCVCCLAARLPYLPALSPYPPDPLNPLPAIHPRLPKLFESTIVSCHDSLGSTLGTSAFGFAWECPISDVGH